MIIHTKMTYTIPSGSDGNLKINYSHLELVKQAELPMRINSVLETSLYHQLNLSFHLASNPILLCVRMHLNYIFSH